MPKHACQLAWIFWRMEGRNEWNSLKNSTYFDFCGFFVLFKFSQVTTNYLDKFHVSLLARIILLIETFRMRKTEIFGWIRIISFSSNLMEKFTWLWRIMRIAAINIHFVNLLMCLNSEWIFHLMMKMNAVISVYWIVARKFCAVSYSWKSIESIITLIQFGESS